MATLKLSLVAGLVLCSLLWIGSASAGRNIEVTSLKPMSKFDNSWIEWSTLRQTKIGRNKFVVSGDIILHRNVGNEQSIDIKAFRKDPKTHSYKNPIYRDKQKLCQYVAMDRIAYPKLIKHSNLPEPGTCPVLKDTYVIKDFTLDTDNFPAFVPLGEYLLTIMFLDGNKEVAGLEAELELS